MNWIDLVVLAACISAIFWGASTGFFKMAVYFVVALLAMAFSSRLAPVVGDALTPSTADEDFQTFVAFIVIFMVLAVGGGLISFWARLILSRVPFIGLPNRILGGLVALFVAVVLLSGLLTAAQRFQVGNIDKSIDESALGGFLTGGFETVTVGMGIIPDSWKDRMRIGEGER